MKILAGFFGDCANGGALLGPATLEFAEGTNYSILAHLTAEGEPTVSVFQNSLAPTLPGYSRLVLHHAAAAPAVQASIGRLTESALDVVTGAIVNVTEEGAEEPASLQIRPGKWRVELLLADDPWMIAFGPLEFVLAPHTAYWLYAVGPADDLHVLILTRPLGRPLPAPVAD